MSAKTVSQKIEPLSSTGDLLRSRITADKQSTLKLPSLKEYKSVLKRLERLNKSGLICLADNCSSQGYDNLKFNPSTIKNTYTLKLHELCTRELRSELGGIQLRLERLKLHLLTYILSGQYRAEKGGPNESKIESIQKELSDALPYRKFKSKKALSKTITCFNKHLPDRYKLNLPDKISPNEHHLLSELRSAMLYAAPYLNSDKFKILLDEVIEYQQKIYELQNQDQFLLFTFDESIERKVKDFYRLDYRNLIKRIAALNESLNWYSPTFGSSDQGETGPNQKSVPFLSDYQRVVFRDIDNLERRIANEYTRDSKKSGDLSALLFPNGSNVFNTLLESILYKDGSLKVSRERPKVFYQIGEIYFEMDGALEYFCKQNRIVLKKFSVDEFSKLSKEFMADWPQAIFMAPLANNLEQRLFDPKQLLEFLTSPQIKLEQSIRISADMHHRYEKLSIIMDNTMCGRSCAWRDFNFSELPEFAQIHAFESLIKFTQDGQDLAPAGLLISIGKYADYDARMIRKIQGTMPLENTVQKLNLVSSDQIEPRISRHSRNASYLARALEKYVRPTSDIFSKIIHPSLPSHPDNIILPKISSSSGAIINLDLDYEHLFKIYFKERYFYRGNESEARFQFSKYSADKVAQAFVKLTIKLCGLADISLNMGTGFGFRSSRIACYKKMVQFQGPQNMSKIEVPYIRLAVGTETLREIILLEHALKRATEIMRIAIKHNRLFDLCSTINHRESELILMSENA